MSNVTENQNASPPRNNPFAKRIPLLIVALVGALAYVYIARTLVDAKPVAVSGVIRINGTPLPSGVISFRAVDPNRGSYAMGSIGKDGSYTAETPHVGAGVLPGEYQVGVLANEDPTKYTREEYDALVGLGKPGIPSLVPKIFTDPGTSGLTVKIAAPGPQVYDLDLKGEVSGPVKSNVSGN